MKTITLQQLRDHNACASQVALFRKYFGTEVELTPEVVQKYASEFDIDWCAQNLLTPELYERYYEATAIAEKQYNEAIAIARKQYDEARAILFVFLYNQI